MYLFLSLELSHISKKTARRRLFLTMKVINLLEYLFYWRAIDGNKHSTIRWVLHKPIS